MKLFYGVSLLAAGATVYTVAQPNQKDQHQTQWPWNVKLLPPEAFGALFIASVGWVLLRDHNARSMRPLVGSTSQWVSTAQTDGLKPSTVYRQVIVSVGGHGSAIIRNVHWRVQAAGDVRPELVDSITVLYARLKDLGLAEGRDYTITNLGRGSSMDAGARLVYSEYLSASTARTDVLPAAKRKIEVLEASIEFESMVGDRFRRIVDLLPAEGASTIVVKPSAGAGPTL
jgi:hypothetical protein